jgi:hypothetical protein
MNNEKWSISELLMELDGAGLIVTDQNLVIDTLNQLGFDENKNLVSMEESDDNEKPQILIEVDGGNIQMIYSTSNVGITVIDHDNIEAGQEELYELDDYGFNSIDIEGIQKLIDDANEEISLNNGEM